MDVTAPAGFLGEAFDRLTACVTVLEGVIVNAESVSLQRVILAATKYPRIG